MRRYCARLEVGAQLPDLDREARDPEAVLKELRAYPERLQARSYDAHDRDIYFYVYNIDTKTCLMNAKHPELEGKEQSHLRDDLGNPILAPLLDAAATGKGVVRYRWRRPSTGQWVEKVGYVPAPRAREFVGQTQLRHRRPRRARARRAGPRCEEPRLSCAGLPIVTIVTARA